MNDTNTKSDGDMSEVHKEKLKEEVENLKKKIDQKKRVEQQYLAEARDYKTKNKILFINKPGNGFISETGKWELNPAQLQMKEAVNSGQYRIFNMCGANQQGKTFFIIYLTLAMIRGCWPEEDISKVGPHLWKKYGWLQTKQFIRLVSDSWEGRVKRNLIAQGLDPLWPDSWEVKKEKNNMGIPYIWKPVNYNSEIQIITHTQGRAAFEGIRSTCTFLDEPWSDQSVWGAIVRSSVALKGIIFIGATIISQDEMWLEELLDNLDSEGDVTNKVFTLRSKTNVNAGFGLSFDSIEFGKSAMSKEESKIRFEGISVLRKSRVVSLEQKHIIPRFKIPHFYYCSAAIDIGLAKPHDILFICQNKDGVRYIAFELCAQGTENFVSQFLEIIKINNLRMNPEILCDPLAKADKNNEMTTWGKISELIYPWGLFLKAGSKSKDEGVRQLNTMLDPIDTVPKLYVFEDMVRTIRQIKSIKYDENGLIAKPRANEVPGDDQFENAYRLALQNTQFVPYIDPLDVKKPKEIKKNLITGY